MQPLLTISVGEAPGQQQQQVAAPSQTQTQQQPKQAPSETGLQGQPQRTPFQISPVRQELDRTWGELLKAAGLMS